ncbi:MAG: glycosyltransferase [Kiritimatiellae bacterium]|nr:glycosyltransferase [Kiritimatiellia bacterium]
MMTPHISIVIPTLGRPILRQTLDSILAAQGADNLEILVVGHIEDTEVLRHLEALASRHPALTHFPVSFPSGDSSRKKNLGAEKSRAEIIAFLDDDVVIAPDWPARILEAFADPHVGLVSGPSLVPPDVTLFARLAGLALTSRAAGYVSERYRADSAHNRPVTWSRIIGCNAAYRASVFREMGGFPPEFYPGEEMIAAWRTQQLGHRLLFLPAAWVYHYPRQSARRFWRQIWGYGATRIRLKRAGVEFEWAPLVPACWVLSLAILGLGALLHPLFALLLALDLALYALADTLITVETARQTRRFSDLLLFPVIPIMHLSYGLAEWYEFFRPNRDFGDRRN